MATANVVKNTSLAAASSSTSLRPYAASSASLPRAHRNAVQRVLPSAASRLFTAGCLASRMITMASAAEDVRGVLFDMDGVLTDSEVLARAAAVDVFAGMGVDVQPEDFIPFSGTGDANFLRSVAEIYRVKDFDVAAAKKKFYDLYINKYATPDSGLGYPGAKDLVLKCKEAGLKTAVASSADQVKVNANLAAAGIPQSIFDAVLSADAFERLKPAPDVFLQASKLIEVPPSQCVVLEDALAGIQAAQAAGMRCIAVSTTLTKSQLEEAGPSLIRKNIGDISLEDILSVKDFVTAT